MTVLAGVTMFPATVSALELFGLKLFEPEEDTTDVADPLRYTLTFTVEGGDADLSGQLRDASAMLADEEKPVSGALGLLAKASSERELLIAQLYELSRYDGVVEITIAGQPLDALPPDAEFGAGPVPVTVTVVPGSVFRLGEIRLKGDAAGLDPAAFGLEPGGDAGSEKILGAEREIVRSLKEQGRPLARITGREIVADHKTALLDVTLTVEAGPVAAFGQTTVEGTHEVDRDFTAYMAGLEEGRTYSPEEMEQARQRLLGLEVFNSVGIAEADALDAQGRIPVTVEVSERKMRYVGVGATYSNTEGLGLEAYWGHRNLFGRAEKLRIEGSISRIGDTSDYGQLNYNAAIMFEKPGALGPPSRFFSKVEVINDHPDAYDRFAAKGEAGFAYDFTPSQSVSASLSLEYADIDDAFGPAEHLIASIPLQYVYDRRDNKLNPAKGWRLVAFAEPSYDALEEAGWLKLRGEISAYHSFDQAGRFVLAGRFATGSILGASVEQVPADRRFYAGGGGSVRGYAYQGIGPRDAEGQPIGGLSFAETSVELRFAVNDQIGIVPFVDAGTVSETQYPDFAEVKVGAGIGLRYLTPFGPLRVDVAVPLNPHEDDPDFGVYAGIGQAF
jgi:translocation and assembly module TamA